MADLFKTVIAVSVSGSLLLAAVIVLRFPLKKAPANFVILLWALAALRLLIPFTLNSPIGVAPSIESVDTGVSAIGAAIISAPEAQAPGYTVPDGEPDPKQSFVIGEVDGPFDVPRNYPLPGGTVNTEAGIIPDKTAESGELASASDKPTRREILVNLAAVLWIGGAAGVIVYTFVSYLRIRRTTKVSAKLSENVFVCDYIETPFVLGVFKPAVYLPSTLKEENRQYVLAHELAHIKRGDHIYKIIGQFILAVHWFNPLVWAAYALYCRDTEFACDEKVIKPLDRDSKADYAQALLDCKPKRRSLLSYPLAFGEIGIKERVKRVFNYKKPAIWFCAAVIVACAVLTACFGTSGDSGAADSDSGEKANGLSYFYNAEVLSEAAFRNAVGWDTESMIYALRDGKVYNYKDGVFKEIPELESKQKSKPADFMKDAEFVKPISSDDWFDGYLVSPDGNDYFVKIYTTYEDKYELYIDLTIERHDNFTPASGERGAICADYAAESGEEFFVYDYPDITFKQSENGITVVNKDGSEKNYLSDKTFFGDLNADGKRELVTAIKAEEDAFYLDDDAEDLMFRAKSITAYDFTSGKEYSLPDKDPGATYRINVSDGEIVCGKAQPMYSSSIEIRGILQIYDGRLVYPAENIFYANDGDIPAEVRDKLTEKYSLPEKDGIIIASTSSAVPIENENEKLVFYCKAGGKYLMMQQIPDAVETVKTVAGFEFYYPTDFRLFVTDGDNETDLLKAFENGEVTKEEISLASGIHDAYLVRRAIKRDGSDIYSAAYDLNGDGKSETVTQTYSGNGIVTAGISVYDPASGKTYYLNDRGRFDYYFENNGSELIAYAVPYSPKGSNVSDAVICGKLRLLDRLVIETEDTVFDNFGRYFYYDGESGKWVLRSAFDGVKYYKDKAVVTNLSLSGILRIRHILCSDASEFGSWERTFVPEDRNGVLVLEETRYPAKTFSMPNGTLTRRLDFMTENLFRFNGDTVYFDAGKAVVMKDGTANSLFAPEDTVQDVFISYNSLYPSNVPGNLTNADAKGDSPSAVIFNVNGAGGKSYIALYDGGLHVLADPDGEFDYYASVYDGKLSAVIAKGGEVTAGGSLRLVANTLYIQTGDTGLSEAAGFEPGRYIMTENGRPRRTYLVLEAQTGKFSLNADYTLKPKRIEGVVKPKEGADGIIDCAGYLFRYDNGNYVFEGIDKDTFTGSSPFEIKVGAVFVPAGN